VRPETLVGEKYGAKKREKKGNENKRSRSSGMKSLIQLFRAWTEGKKSELLLGQGSEIILVHEGREKTDTVR